MAEPVGIIGTAAGIVSFGLQLYSAVATYIDALDGRKDDLASAHAQLDSLRGSLTTIQSAVSTPSFVSTRTSTLLPIVTECKKELDQLQVLLQDLVGSNASGNKLKERIKILKFPFRRDSLMKLEDRLYKTNSVFQIALSVLNLNKSLDNERIFANMEAATAQVPAISTNVVHMSADVRELRTNVTQMFTDVNDVISTMKLSNNATILSRVDSSVAELAATAGQSLPQISNSIALMERQMQSFSALEDRLRKLSLLEHALGYEDIQGQANPQLALQRLLTKPSQTQEIYDSMSHSMSMTPHHGSSPTAAYDWLINAQVTSQSCSCLDRNSRRGTSRRFVSLWLRTETISHEHDRNCELSRVKLARSRRRFELTTTRPFLFLPWSLGFSFALTTGAGGFSISPNITFRPIINEKKSPVFRILETLQNFLIYGCYTSTDISCSLSATKNTILQLYWRRKAFANETTEWGTSAISRLVDILDHPAIGARDLRKRHTVAEALSDMIVELVHAGLPADRYNYCGMTPVTQLALSEIAIHTKGLLPVLYKAAIDPVITRSDYLSSIHDLRDLRCYCEPKDSSLKKLFDHIRTEIFGCGPLSAAITAHRDEQQIKDLIIAKPAPEFNLLHQTPLHLAAGTGKANVLDALLRTKAMNGTIHALDPYGDHAIDYAAFHSGVSCRNGRAPLLCSDCSCTSALDALLCAEGCFDGYLRGISETSPWRFLQVVQCASHSSKLRLFTEIKLRRDELKHLALSYLDIGDIQHCKVDGDGVLDHHGIEVVECLTDMDVDVPVRLRDSLLDPREGPSIYRMIPWLNEHETQALFDLGFRDIDEPDELGLTPLMGLDTTYSDDLASSFLWYMEHGADLTRTVPDTRLRYTHSCSTTAHLVSHVWGGSGPLGTWEDAHFISKIAPVSTRDDCRCYCTEIGCTAASILFHYLPRKHRWHYDDLGDRPLRFWQERQEVTMDAVSFLAEFFENYDVDLTDHRHVCMSALRMLTFETLGIKHTCGCRDSDEVSLNEEDAEDIWEEDVHLIGRLNKLLTEFEVSFDYSGMSLGEFLVKGWIPRMEIILQELDEVELSEAEYRNVELLGVKWDPCDAHDDTPDGDSLIARSFQDYLRAIRKIAEE